LAEYFAETDLLYSDVLDFAFQSRYYKIRIKRLNSDLALQNGPVHKEADNKLVKVKCDVTSSQKKVWKANEVIKFDQQFEKKPARSGSKYEINGEGGLAVTCTSSNPTASYGDIKRALGADFEITFEDRN
jgi:hypothetical protein